MQQTEDI